jgi:hypothetical protein
MRFQLWIRINELTGAVLPAPLMLGEYETFNEALTALIARQRTGGTLYVWDTVTEKMTDYNQ